MSRRWFVRATLGVLFVSAAACSVDQGADEAPDLGPQASLVPVPPEGVDDSAGGGAGGSFAFDDARPLPALVRADPPPPIAGGTLALDDRFAVAADPDRDAVYVVERADWTLKHVVPAGGGEPGRVVIGAGRAYVALRRGGGVMAIDLESGRHAHHATCPSPRGLALQGDDRLHVACAGGELVTLSGDGSEVRRVLLEPDLRDVVVAGDRLYVSVWRAAALLTLGPRGEVLDRRLTKGVRVEGARSFFLGASHVAWRTTLGPDGNLYMLHQRVSPAMVATSPGAYGGEVGVPCDRPVTATAISVFPPDGDATDLGAFPRSVLAVDLAVKSGRFALAAAGNLETGGAPVRSVTLERPPPRLDCEDEVEQVPSAEPGPERPATLPPAAYQVVAVAYDARGDLYALSREPAALLDVRMNERVRLADGSRFETGHDLFHRDAGGGLACASCHPEGHEDGHAWDFEDVGLRRTQSLRGGLRGTEPFHWNGDMTDFRHLVSDVMGGRMGGPQLSRDYVEVLLDWIDALPPWPAPAVEDVAAAERGRRLFADAAVGCASCHSGPHLSDGLSHDVGTHATLQTPRLAGVAMRLPLLHDGCATTLEERFKACDGGDLHGRTSHLDARQIADLVAYLKSL